MRACAALTLLVWAQPRSVDELREVRHTLELYRQNYSMQVACYCDLQAL